MEDRSPKGQRARQRYQGPRVPDVVLWVKDPTAAAQVTAEVQVWSLAWELPHATAGAKKKKKGRKEEKDTKVPPLAVPSEMLTAHSFPCFAKAFPYNPTSNSTSSPVILYF